MDLAKLIDKLEPLDELSMAGASVGKYYGVVEETIEEEISDHDEELDKKSKLSLSSQSRSSRNRNSKMRPEN